MSYNKFIFYYGTMNAGKSSMILRLVHEYHEQHKHILTIKPLISARTSKTDIVDRAGEHYPADIIESKNTSFKQQLLDTLIKYRRSGLDLVVADEAQFLQPSSIEMLSHILHKTFPSVTVMLFGLLKDYQNKLFPTSKFLIEYCDDLREIKSICWYCNRKATCNLRINNSKPVYKGQERHIGGNDDYKAVCRYHYYHPVLK